MASNKYPPVTVANAYNLYMDSDLNVPQIAERIGVPTETLRTWIRLKKWPEHKRQLLAELTMDVDAERKAHINKNVLKVVKRHLTASEVIEDEIIANVNSNKGRLKPREISDLAKALSQSSGVSARVIGIDKTSSVEQIGGNNTNVSVASGSIVQIGLQPLSDEQAKEHEEQEALDVTSEIEEPTKYTDFPD